MGIWFQKKWKWAQRSWSWVIIEGSYFGDQESWKVTEDHTSDQEAYFVIGTFPQSNWREEKRASDQPRKWNGEKLRNPWEIGNKGGKDGQGPPTPILWTMWTWTRLIFGTKYLEPSAWFCESGVGPHSELKLNPENLNQFFNFDETGGHWWRSLWTWGKFNPSNLI